MVVVRENTEGEYAQVGGFLYHHKPDEVAIQTAVFTRRGIERIIRFAFDLARRRDGRTRHLDHQVERAGLRHGAVGPHVPEVAAEYPDIETESLLVDAAAMNFVRRPQSFDVVVGSNLFGDILSDISAIVTGSIGPGAQRESGPDAGYPSMFEPVHGSAPDIAGRGIVNPMATILSAGMMLDFLGLEQAGAEVEKGVMAVLSEGQTLPADLGGSAGTSAIGQAVIEKLS